MNFLKTLSFVHKEISFVCYILYLSLICVCVCVCVCDVQTSVVTICVAFWFQLSKTFK